MPTEARAANSGGLSAETLRHCGLTAETLRHCADTTSGMVYRTDPYQRTSRRVLHTWAWGSSRRGARAGEFRWHRTDLDLQDEEGELPQGGADRDDDDGPHEPFSNELGGSQDAVDHHADPETMAEELVHGGPTLSNGPVEEELRRRVGRVEASVHRVSNGQRGRESQGLHNQRAGSRLSRPADVTSLLQAV